MRVCVCVCVCAPACARVYVYMCVYIYIYIYIYLQETKSKDDSFLITRSQLVFPYFKPRANQANRKGRYLSRATADKFREFPSDAVQTVRERQRGRATVANLFNGHEKL